MRPTYESEADLVSEQSVVSTLAREWRCSAEKLPRSYHVDYLLTRDGRKLWLEVKCRKNPMSRYPTFAVSMNKVAHGLMLAATTGHPFLLAVGWTDATGWLRVQRGTFDVAFGGRTDRGDWQDREPMAHFDINNFALIAQCANIAASS